MVDSAPIVEATGLTAPHRVAMVLASSTGGVGRHVANLAHGLLTCGIEVDVYGPAATDDQFGFAALGARFAAVEIPPSPQPRDAVAVRVLRRLLREPDRRADVLHAHGMRAGLVAALTRLDEDPLVVTWHNQILTTGLRGEVYRRVEKYVARSADVTLGASADLVAHAMELGARDARLGAVGAPILPPPSRSPDDIREELGALPGQPLILSVGRLHPQKQYDLLVAAAARWATRDPAPLVAIAGRGPAYLKLAGQISRMRAPVTLIGHRNDVSDLLNAADLAVVTSAWEARQLFAQEALRAGVPLITTAVGGIPELVGDAAVLIAGHVDAIDDAVSHLLDEPAIRAEYAQRGPVQAKTWPTDADTLRQLVGIYAELARAGAA